MVCPMCIAAAFAANAPVIAAAFGGLAALKLASPKQRQGVTPQKPQRVTPEDDRVNAAPTVRPVTRVAPYKAPSMVSHNVQ